MSLIVSIVLFVVFAANVAIGSFTGKPFLGDIGEMLLLLAASLAFVAAILAREASARKDSSN